LLSQVNSAKVKQNKAINTGPEATMAVIVYTLNRPKFQQELQGVAAYDFDTVVKVCMQGVNSPGYKIVISNPIIVIVICKCCYRQLTIITLVPLVSFTAIVIIIMIGIFGAGNVCHAIWGLYMRREGDMCTSDGCTQTQATFDSYSKPDVPF